MKYFILLLFVLFSFDLMAQDEVDKEYYLNASEDWRKELIPFPLGFAPSLAYEGVEDIRFSKGWADKQSEQFWSYKFVWYLDKDPVLTEDKLQTDFELYFDGLMSAVANGKKIPADSITSTTALFINTSEGIYRGKVKTFDAFFLEAPVTLNFNVRSLYCSERSKYLVYFEVSPQPLNHNIWKEMSTITVGGNCE
ncbi:MAG: hypothetical protein AAFN93_00975 [Bacteroidota bacterium]